MPESPTDTIPEYGIPQVIQTDIIDRVRDRSLRDFRAACENENGAEGFVDRLAQLHINCHTKTAGDLAMESVLCSRTHLG